MLCLFRSGCGEAIPVQAKTQDGTVVVDVPNELLMHRANIVVDLIGRESCRTIFDVKHCERPADYEFVQNIIPPANESGGTVDIDAILAALPRWEGGSY